MKLKKQNYPAHLDPLHIVSHHGRSFQLLVAKLWFSRVGVRLWAHLFNPGSGYVLRPISS